jgi:hypothetical protein
MSSYRDDVNDTVVMGDATWAGLSTIGESTVRMSDAALFGLAMLVVDAAVLGDQVYDRTLCIVDEALSASDTVLGRATLRSLVSERAIASDDILSALASLVTESLVVSDAVVLRTRAAVSDTVRVDGTALNHRIARQMVAEQARLTDAVPFAARQLVEDAAAVAGSTIDRLRARALVVDALVLADEIVSGGAGGQALVTELVRMAGEHFDRLHARDLVNDLAAALWDEALQPGADVGQAWTAPTDGWATSRYAPFTFASLAVIDGKAYALGHDGIYALDGDGELIEAQARTGMVDMTGGVLCHPLQSIISYELAGSAWLDVWQTHGGVQAEHHTYPLPVEPAAVLTTGRFALGRGLRGRHFQYALRLTGQRAHINDWSVTIAPSKRSI